METHLSVRLLHHEILQRLRNEIIVNEEMYTNFFAHNIPLFRLQAMQYFDMKCYNSDFGDLLPLIAATAFDLQIIILAFPKLQLRDCHIVTSFHVYTVSCPYVILHLSQEYYSGTAPNIFYRRNLTIHATLTAATSCYSPGTLNISAASSASSAGTSVLSAASCVDAPSSVAEPCTNASTASPTLSASVPIKTSMTCTSTPTPAALLCDDATSKSSASHANASTFSTTSRTGHPISFFPLLVAYLNIQGLLGDSKRGADSHRKLDELRISLSENNALQLLCLNETWLSHKVDSSEIAIDNYNIVRRDRKHGECGGILLYVNQSLKYSKVFVDSKRYPNLEICVIKILPQHAKSLTVCSIYRPPSSKSDWLDAFHAFLDDAPYF